MTMQEASERYHIPMHILQEYRRWGLCGAVKNVMGDWQYDDADLERLSTIMTLHDIGFTAEEVEAYMHLLLEGDHTAVQRLNMLEKKRSAALDCFDTALYPDSVQRDGGPKRLRSLPV